MEGKQVAGVYGDFSRVGRRPSHSENTRCTRKATEMLSGSGSVGKRTQLSDLLLGCCTFSHSKDSFKFLMRKLPNPQDVNLRTPSKEGKRAR